jgi:hypothetical protein
MLGQRSVARRATEQIANAFEGYSLKNASTVGMLNPSFIAI